MEKHKCTDCGLLAARNSQTRELEEMQEDYRFTGKAPMWSVEVPRRVTGIVADWVGKEGLSDPLCFIRAWNLSSEFKAEGTGTSAEKCLRILGKERECSSFIEWQQGFTPKEHREMMNRERMLKWQAEREDKDKEWQKSHNRQMVILGAIIGGFFGLITTGLGIGLTYLLTHGSNK